MKYNKRVGGVLHEKQKIYQQNFNWEKICNSRLDARMKNYNRETGMVPDGGGVGEAMT